mmetsp:Transcript_15965/g.27209  ORF Transcript_15965/g.27209 Transcript_15965/m.27209 type:complete len:91 (-) Transcript_15965:19-291(-)
MIQRSSASSSAVHMPLLSKSKMTVNVVTTYSGDISGSIQKEWYLKLIPCASIHFNCIQLPQNSLYNPPRRQQRAKSRMRTHFLKIVLVKF